MQASLSFEPSQLSVSAGEVVPIDVNIYGGENAVISSDVWISYDPSVLSVNTSSGAPNFEKGPLFENVQAKSISPGSLYLYAINGNSAEKNATGKVATVYFNAIKGGQSELRFDCVSFGEKTSQIIESSSELDNVINCNLTRAHTATIHVSSQNNVLGATTSNTLLSPLLYLCVGLLIIFLAGILMYRYRQLSKQLSE